VVWNEEYNQWLEQRVGEGREGSCRQNNVKIEPAVSNGSA